MPDRKTVLTIEMTYPDVPGNPMSISLSRSADGDLETLCAMFEHVLRSHGFHFDDLSEFFPAKGEA